MGGWSWGVEGTDCESLAYIRFFKGTFILLLAISKGFPHYSGRNIPLFLRIPSAQRRDGITPLKINPPLRKLFLSR